MLLPIIPIIASAGVTLLTTLLVFICLLLIVVILVQKPTGGGLVGAFGGAGGVQDFLGAKMGSKITWFTVVLFSSFVILACTLTILVKPDYLRAAPAVTTAPAVEVPAKSTDTGAPAAATTEPKSAVESAPASAPATAPATEKTP